MGRWSIILSPFILFFLFLLSFLFEGLCIDLGGGRGPVRGDGEER